MSVFTGAGRVLRNRNSGLYLVGVAVSSFGTSAMVLAVGIWAKSLTGSSSLAALTAFCIWLPTLAGPAVGILADRMPRRPLLIRANCLMAVLLTVLLSVRSESMVWLLFAVLLCYGTSLVLMDAVEAALVPFVVPKELLGDVNGLRLTANEGMKLLAPLVGAGLFARFGGAPVALLDAATFAVAACAFALMPVREPARTPAVKPQWRRQTAEGITHLRRHRSLRALVSAGATAMFLGGVNGAVIYAVVDSGLHRPPSFAGVLYACQGFGSVIGGVAAGPLMRHIPQHRFAALGIVVFAVGAAARALPSLWAVLPGSFGIGLGLPAVLIAAMTAVQQQTPDTLVGRVAASTSTLLFVPNAVALGAGAGILALADYRMILAAVGAAALGTGMYCLFQGKADE
jgi:MFS family permease